MIAIEFRGTNKLKRYLNKLSLHLFLDIALIKLPIVRFRAGARIDIKTIDINTDRDNKDLIGKIITLSGWGGTKTSPDKPVPDLMKVNQEIVEPDAIDHGHIINKERLLQANQKGGKGGCHGDSGGKKIQN